MNYTASDTGHKIGAHHVARTAFVYVRQSTIHQVRNHLESRRRQYDLVGQITGLGWPKERVVLIDEDQGKSGASAGTRAGFGRLVAAVARSEAGIVSCLEMSRLARNNVDWHQLVYLCRWTDTLIADETGIDASVPQHGPHGPRHPRAGERDRAGQLDPSHGRGTVEQGAPG